MPLYDFLCQDCGEKFEEICPAGASPVCPQCKSVNTCREISLPGPLKKGAFPFKPQPPRKMPATQGGCAK